MDQELKEFLEEEPKEGVPGDFDEETLKRAGEFEKIMTEEIEEYEASAGDFETLLKEDHALLEELADASSLLILAELAMEKDDMDLETLETAYLNVIDKGIELSKTYHPLSELGKDRLWMALSFTEQYGEKYRPLLTQVTKNNAEKFAQFLPERFLDDIRFDLKSAIGALRYVDGNAYAVGIAVYHFETGAVTDDPILRIDHVYVDEEFRQHGVGNMLIARLFGFAAQYPECTVTVSYVPPRDPDEKAAEDQTVTWQYLDSWKFDFSMTFGSDFCIKTADLEGNKGLERGVNSVVSLATFSSEGEAMLKSFFEKRNDEDDAEISSLPYSYFNENASCAIVQNREITHLLLIRRYESGNYRIVFWDGPEDSDAEDLVQLVSFACRILRMKAGPDALLTGTFNSEENMDVLQKILPTAKMRLTYEGILMKPRLSEDITTEQWMELMEEIGTPHVLEKDQTIDEKLFTKRGMYEMRNAFEEIAKELPE